jgi:FMN phosphatase YigB (HAD superfamily)
MNISADEAVMVGNDVDDDMVAKELGMKVFLVTDCLINKSGKGLLEYPSGTLDDFMEYLTSLT